MSVAKQYSLAERGAKRFLVSPSSQAILKALAAGSQFNYPELSETSGVPLSSIYVFCERLEKAKLLKRVYITKAGPNGAPVRVRTEIKRLGEPLVFPNLTVIR